MIKAFPIVLAICYSVCIFHIITADILDTQSKSIMLDEAIDKLTQAAEELADKTVYTPVFYNSKECLNYD